MRKCYYTLYTVTPAKGFQRLRLSDCRMGEKLNVTIFLSHAIKNPVNAINAKIRLKFIMWQYVESFAGSSNYYPCCRALALKRVED